MYHLLNTLQCLVETSLASCSLPAPSPPPSCQPSLPFSAGLMGAITACLHHCTAWHCIPLHSLHSTLPSVHRCTIAKIEHSTLHELTRGFTSETILLWDVTSAFRTWQRCSAGRAGPLGRARCSCTALLRPSAVGVGAVGGVARSGTPQMFGNAPWFSRGCNKDEKAEK